MATDNTYIVVPGTESWSVDIIPDDETRVIVTYKANLSNGESIKTYVYPKSEAIDFAPDQAYILAVRGQAQDWAAGV